MNQPISLATTPANSPQSIAFTHLAYSRCSDRDDLGPVRDEILKDALFQTMWGGHVIDEFEKQLRGHGPACPQEFRDFCSTYGPEVDWRALAIVLLEDHFCDLKRCGFEEFRERIAHIADVQPYEPMRWLSKGIRRRQ